MSTPPETAFWSSSVRDYQQSDATPGRTLAAIAGIAFFLLSIAVAVVAPPPPTLVSSASAVAAYYSRYQSRFLWGNYLGIVGGIVFLPFLGYFTSEVRRAEKGQGPLAILVLLTGISAGSTGFCIVAALQTAAVLTGPEMAPIQKGLSDLANMFFGSYLVTNAGFTGVLGWAGLSTRVIGRALSWLAIVISVATLVASLGMVIITPPLAAGGPFTVLAFVAFLFWILIVSIVLLIRKAAV
jgi:hypothetical protein